MDGELNRINKLQGGEGWAVWKFQVRVILNASELFDVVTGESKKPVLHTQGAETNEESNARYKKELEFWKKLDSQSQKVIATTIGQQPMSHIMYCTSAKEMWEKLNTIYEQKSSTSLHLLQQQFYGLSLDSSKDLACHISKIEELAQRLKEAGEVVSESMIVTKILMTLPERYNHFFSAWESTSDDRKTLSNLTVRLMMEESRLSSQRNNEKEEVEAFVAKKWKHNFIPRTGSENDKENKDVYRCFLCHKPGHFKKDCPLRNSKSNDVNDRSKRSAFIGEVLTVGVNEENRNWLIIIPHIV